MNIRPAEDSAKCQAGMQISLLVGYSRLFQPYRICVGTPAIQNKSQQPVDPSVPKRPKAYLSVRTGNPLLWVSQNLPANKAQL